MYRRFGLVLAVDHECNMRCTYCYAGAKFRRPLPFPYGRKAIDRAVASLAPGGTLELAFFGGEPLLQAELVCRLVAHARRVTGATGNDLAISLTTNGTIDTPAAWSIMLDHEVALAISCDGAREVHDRHRVFADGRGSSDTVLGTMRRLHVRCRDFHVVMVIRPDTVERMAQGIKFLRSTGVTHIEPALDLWACWTAQDVFRLRKAIAESARTWAAALPHLSVSWFDEKAALLARLPVSDTARCAFGAGEVAVAPSGHLYPCERVIGTDEDANPMRLPGHVLEGSDFLDLPAAPCRAGAACDTCGVADLCNTTCRCSNYVRTGDVSHPDRLLCIFNQACLEETAHALASRGLGRVGHPDLGPDPAADCTAAGLPTGSAANNGR